MATIAQNAIVKALVEGVLTELMVKTIGDNVYVDETTTLTAKLAEIITSVSTKTTSAEVTTIVNTAIDNLVNGAPAALDTLKELADAIDANSSVVDALNAAIGNKVDKIDGKGLSTEDFTTILKAKLDGIEASAQVNVIETINVNGIPATVTTKAVDLTIPTGTLASKDTVAETDFDTALATKFTALVTDQHTHDNKTVLDGITAEKVSAWDSGSGSSNIYIQSTEPAALTDKDIWLDLLT